jgi:glucosamine--fructose-6-phosphate aminotransferase (isomerizing)
MCGIIGIVSKKPVIRDIVECLGKLEYRGYDSYGIAILSEDIVVKKDVGCVPLNIGENLRGTIGIGHTRWATHGEVTKLNAHPHTSCDGEIAIVHNGIIENYQELKDELIREGHVFKSQTDSEVVAHLIEKYKNGGLELGYKLSFEQAINRLKGSYAIVAMHKDYPYLMVACKDSPLMIGYTKDSVYLSSDVEAIKGDIQEVADNSIRSIGEGDFNDGKIKYVNTVKTNNKQGYADYMLKEIYEQPDALMKALKQDKEELVGVSLDILRARDVILTACGTSRFASIVGRYLMLRLGKRMSETIVGSELHYFAGSFGENTLVIAVSQSGETADVLAGVKLAKQRGSYIISMVNKPYSSLERISNKTLMMNCGSEIAVASTKAFTNELVLFYLLAFTMANKYDEGLIELTTLPGKIKECLLQTDKVKKIADILKDSEHIYYIGKGINYAVAGECALKLKEVSYIHAESMSSGELKHGTLSLIEKGTPVIGLCPDDYTYQETISNLHEAKSRKGIIIGISDKDNEVFDYWIPIPKVRDIYYPLVSVIVGQLLAYYVAVKKGLPVDRPRNLAKSVTVK